MSTRPKSLTKSLEKDILTACAYAELTAGDVAAFLAKDTNEAAEGFFEKFAHLQPKHVAYVLEAHESETRMRAELGLDKAEEEERKREAKKKAAADMSYDAAAQRLRQRYVYGAFRNEVYDRLACDWIYTQALDAMEHANMPFDEKGRRYTAFSILKNDPNADRVHNERYIPGEHSDIVERSAVSWLNTWKPSDVVPADGDAQPMVRHILYLCNGDREKAAHVLNWLAFMVQFPGHKINHALLIISTSQGVGKDTVANAMQRILGRYNVQFVQDEDVSEGRYDFMKRAQIVVVPETMSGDRKDLANKLKPLLTQEVVRINEKNVKPYNIENIVNFLMFSNHENAAHIEDQDRRYFVNICRAAPMPTSYYDDLHAYIASDRIAGFADFLMKRDITGFNAKAPAPLTDDKATVQRATRGGVEAWLDDAWETEAMPFNRRVVNLRDALTCIAEDKGPRMTIQQLSAFLKKKGGGDLGPVRIGGSPIRLWAVRDFDKIKDMTPAEKDFELQGGIKNNNKGGNVFSIK